MSKEYGVYVVRPEDIPQNEKYYLITPKWSLLYTNAKPPKTHRKITDDKTLHAQATEWLQAPIEQIREEYLKEHEQEVLRNGKAFTERFEAELKAEKEKLQQEV